MDLSSGPGGSGINIDVASCFQVCLPRGKLKHCDGDLMWFTQVEHGLEAKSQTQSQTAGWKRNCLALGFCWKEQLRFVLRSFRKQMLMWVDAPHKQARGLWILGWHHMFLSHFPCDPEPEGHTHLKAVLSLDPNGNFWGISMQRGNSKLKLGSLWQKTHWRFTLKH